MQMKEMLLNLNSKRFFFAVAILVTLACVFPGQGHADVRQAPATTLTSCPPDTGNVDYTCYEVEGSTPEQIMRSIRANTPVRSKKWGSVLGKISYSYRDVRISDGTCRIISASTSFFCQIHMPVWRQPRDTSPNTVLAWNSMFEALHSHELHHCQITQSTAVELESKISQAAVAKCEDMDDFVKSIFRRIWWEYGMKQEDYDLRTNHGALEGVTISRPGGGAPSPLLDAMGAR